MKSQARKHILEACRKNDVKFVQLWFTDILGQLKSLTITTSKLPSALEEGASFDGSSVEGFARIYESDLVVLPDPSTFQVLPWTSHGPRVARMICDVADTELKPYEGDPRHVLRRTVEMLKRKGLTPYIGPEIEYFYFASSKEPRCSTPEAISISPPSMSARNSGRRPCSHLRQWTSRYTRVTMR